MKLFIADAFSDKIFCGNQAGVVLIEKDFPEDKVMLSIAAELKHSETAFVKKEKNLLKIRYFTPKYEVDLCGHATVGTCRVLLDEGIINSGQHIIETLAGNLKVIVENNEFYLEMAEGKIVQELEYDEALKIYRAFGLDEKDFDERIKCSIVNTGLSDILLPVRNKEALNKAVMNKEEVIKISKEYNIIGIHMYVLNDNDEVTADCRNFAPVCGIDEECATGTSNGALTYYLCEKKLINKNEKNLFVQGEAMNKSCRIYSCIKNDRIFVGGNAVVSIKGEINL